VKETGEVQSARFDWPADIRVVVVSPHAQLPTHVARAALPKSVTRVDAVYNLQRASLFIGAVAQRKSDWFWDAMRDRLHQPKRESLVPGLSEVLALPRQDGLLGLALSGAGPSVLALVNDNDAAVGRKIAKCFSKHKIRSKVRILEVDPSGCKMV
jgi:homoserine kinase